MIYMFKKGYKQSDEHRRKLSEQKKGMGNPYWGIKGPGHPRFGTKHSAQTRQKISAALQGKIPWNFKAASPGYWRNIVVTRDDYTCQICSLRDPEIVEVDHIKPRAHFPALQRAIENLITLCPNCHVRKTKRDRRNGFQ